jgi:anthranilate phosphoribosyltransferase
MSLSHALKSLVRKERLSEKAARQLTAALLDGGVPELEEGAFLALLEERADERAELEGCRSALVERCFRIARPDRGARPVVLPSHGGTTGQPNLTALVALSPQRLNVPVIVHGVLSTSGGVVAASVLRELGVLPCVTLSQVQKALDTKGLAFAPTAVLVPGLAHLLALRSRLGFGGFAQRLARFADPFAGASLLVLAASDERECVMLRDVLRESDGAFLLLEASHGEAFADPQRRPALGLVRGGAWELLFSAGAAPSRPAPNAPSTSDARETAAWIGRVLRGELPMPLPVVNQIACCLYGAGYTVDMNQAKAIAAVQTGSLLAA